MLIVPAIDIMDAKVVRLQKGDFQKVSTYELSPLDCAKKWLDQGASLIHVVDLDGAKVGAPKNFEVIADIIDQAGGRVEVGGGIRSASIMKRYLEAGAGKVVLGTGIINDDLFLRADYVKKNIASVVASIDINRIVMEPKGGTVGTGTNAWLETVNIKIAPFLRYLSSLGVRSLNFSDITRDGTMMGPDLDNVLGFLAVARASVQHEFSYTYAGGIASLDDLSKMRSLGREGVNAVIVGKALYENKFSLKEAIDLLS